ncbi:MAG: hypothetical protein HZB26_20475 [Candidatus Hydrogenedentes bacterium]|nr:hypothetical protein [Candidatus Hydrogenedentota bacterium]
MKFEVRLPAMGEDATEEATVAYWPIEEGEVIHEGDDLVELTTDKAAFSVPSPKTGTLVEKVVEEGDEVEVGDLICILDV